MTKECQNLINEMIALYSEYLEEEKVDSANFLITVLASHLIQARQEVQFLRLRLREYEK